MPTKMVRSIKKFCLAFRSALEHLYSYCFPANPVVCGYSSAVIRAELSFFRKLSRKEKGSLPKRASSRDPLSERALKQLRFLLSHVLGMIASPASTGRLVLGNS